MGNEIEFYKQWLSKDKKSLKLLLFIGLTVDKNNMIKCKLKDIRDFIGITNNQKNNDSIKNILEELQIKKYIKYDNKENSQDILISIDTDNLKEIDRIRGIQKQWVLNIKQANRDENNKKIDKSISADWSVAFKILVNFHIGNFKSIMKQTEIGKIINMSKDTVNDALKLLLLSDINFMKETIKEKHKIFELEGDKYIEKWVSSAVGTHLNMKQDFSSK